MPSGALIVCGIKFLTLRMSVVGKDKPAVAIATLDPAFTAHLKINARVTECAAKSVARHSVVVHLHHLRGFCGDTALLERALG
jgi:hypothetical protein